MGKKLLVLVGCEESQAVCKAFRQLGHIAYSCDIQECSGGSPEWHIQQDIMAVIPLRKWDIIILHPPCTYIANSGNRWYAGTDLRKDAIAWTQNLWDVATFYCARVALENPVGSLRLPIKPIYYQPWQFGHGEVKKTGFWLHGLPELIPTQIVEGREPKVHYAAPGIDRGKIRSKTLPGIARAMAEQWGGKIN